MARITDLYIQPGNVLDATLPYNREVAEGFLVGNLFMIATKAGTTGQTVPGVTDGVWDIAKTAAQTFTEGALVYWDDTAKSVTAVTTGNRRIGSATRAAAGGDATARVRLTGVPCPTGA